MPFVYSFEAQSKFNRTITIDRLTSYLAVTKGDTASAIMLYERNTMISEGLYGILQPLEISVRNAIHDVMSKDTARLDWYELPLFQPQEIRTIAEAKANITRWKKTISPGRVVSELTFGFWVKLISAKYEKTLWVPHLYKSFPALRKPDRVTIFNRLDNIRNLRNRVAHHEQILSRN